MIISRTPFRISYIGGGTDLSNFYREHYGAVVSTTIDKYIYLSMHPFFNDNGYHLKYSQNEVVNKIDDIKHSIIREVFKEYNITGVDFNSTSDVPSGTGLGSSSTFTTGLINLCSSYNKVFIKKEEIAKKACDVEIRRLGAPVGKQDQYAAAIGGLNYIQFNPDESVLVEKICLSQEKLTQLNNSLLLFYLGGVRDSASVLKEQQKKIPLNIGILKRMANLAEELRDELKGNSIDNFGRILHEGWMYKKELASNVTNGAVDYWYKKARDNGAEGGKLLGAGGSGFLLVYASERKEVLSAAMRLYELPFKFEDSGTTIIYA